MQKKLKLPALKGGVLPFGSASQPGKGINLFKIASLNPPNQQAGLAGKQTGQN
jgi:hypothetical protein